MSMGWKLYYGSLSWHGIQIADLYALFRDCMLEVDAELERVSYYTAPAKATFTQTIRLRPRVNSGIYTRSKHIEASASKSLRDLFSRTTPILRLARPRQSAVSPAKVRVFQFTEKQTDVNLAADIISDACHDRCEQAVGVAPTTETS